MATGFGKLWLSSGEPLSDSVNQFQFQSIQPALITSHEEAKKLDLLSAHIDRKQKNISPAIFDLSVDSVNQDDGGFLGHTLDRTRSLGRWFVWLPPDLSVFESGRATSGIIKKLPLILIPTKPV